MTLKEIEERLAQIKTELENPDCDVDALSTEVKNLKEERQKILDDEEKRQALLDDVANSVTVEEIVKMPKEEIRQAEIATTPEEMIKTQAYERAFAKTIIAKANDTKVELTEDEQRALNTTNGTALIPHVWLTEIYDQIREQHPILEDLTWQQINGIVEIPRRLAITSGDAAVMEEGTCPLGEENEFDSIQVDLIEIQKMLEITAKMGQLLPDAFKAWLVAEVRDRIGAKMAEEAIKAIKADTLTENKLAPKTAGAVELADILNLYGAAEGNGVAKVYANRKTLYTHLYAIKGAQGQDAYIPNAQDPISGFLLGSQLRQEDAMADGEVLVLFPDEVFFNVPGGIRVKQMEDECFKIKISGITFMGLRLKYRKAAAVLAIGEPAGA